MSRQAAKPKPGFDLHALGITILDAMEDDLLFGRFFKGDSWGPWKSFISAAFGLGLRDPETFTKHTKRTEPPKDCREAWLCVGRRAGKSRIVGLIAVVLACLRNYEGLFALGEEGKLMVIGADRKGARVLFRYIRAMIKAVPVLERMVMSETRESIELSNGVSIEVQTASFRSIRGYTVVAALCDEIAFWRDENCLPWEAQIQTDHGPMTIHQIVRGKLRVRVKSLMPESGEIVWREVSGWSENRCPEGWWRISWGHGNNGARMTSTPDHPVLTAQGWKRAQEIVPGDRVIITGRGLTGEQQEIALGTLLGDGHMSRAGNEARRGKAGGYPRLILAHGEKQWSYLDWKATALATLGGGVTPVKTPKIKPKIRGREINGGRVRRFQTLSMACLDELYAISHRDGKKRVTAEWLERVGVIGLAVWTMDDGTMLITRRVDGSPKCRFMIFCTDSFSDAERGLLIEWLRTRFGLLAHAVRKGRVMLSSSSTRQFEQLIAPYLRFEGSKKQWVAEPIVAEKLERPLPMLVTESRVSARDPRRTHHKYDIAVPGTHCFVLKSGLVVHNSSNPDTEILNAVRPGMGTVPGAILLCLSSPYARRGAMWEAYERYFGKNDSPVLVWQAATLEMNPGFPKDIVDNAYEEDKSSARAEYGGEFRDDIESYVPPSIIRDATIVGRTSLPFVAGHNYVAFLDPSGGSEDSYALAIGHREGEKSIIDLVKEFVAPFDPLVITGEAAKIVKSYGLRTATGDHYAGEWPKSEFKKHGVAYEQCPVSKSDIYRETLPVLMGGKAELIDLKRLRVQYAALERRPTPSGREIIDHPKGVKDDLSNVVSGVLWKLRTIERVRPTW